MKLSEAIEWAKQSDTNDWTDISEVIDAAGFPSYILDLDYDDSPFTEVDLVSWMCTDTVVGWKVVFMNDDPIALLYKPYRKSNINLAWVPVNGADPRPAIRSWAISKIDNEDDPENLVNLDDEVSLSDIIVDERNELFVNVFDEV